MKSCGLVLETKQMQPFSYEVDNNKERKKK